VGHKKVRKGDNEAQDFPSSDNRLIRRDGVWFFESREGRKGPYLSRLDAQEMLSSYVETMEYLEERRVPSQFDPTDVTIIRFDQKPDSEDF
jgi:hypothetical protein